MEWTKISHDNLPPEETKVFVRLECLNTHMIDYATWEIRAGYWKDNNCVMRPVFPIVDSNSRWTVTHWMLPEEFSSWIPFIPGESQPEKGVWVIAYLHCLSEPRLSSQRIMQIDGKHWIDQSYSKYAPAYPYDGPFWPSRVTHWKPLNPNPTE